MSRPESEDEMDQEEAKELISELEDMRDEIAQAISRILDVERALPIGAMRERLRQARAGFEMALSQENDWLGSSAYTLEGSIDELRQFALQPPRWAVQEAEDQLGAAEDDVAWEEIRSLAWAIERGEARR